MDSNRRIESALDPAITAQCIYSPVRGDAAANLLP